MKIVKIWGWILLYSSLTFLPASLAWPDGGYVRRTESIAISTDQRAIIIKNGDEISMTFSTGYTGEGEDFGWTIPTPVPPAVDDVVEAGRDGESAFEFLDRMTGPIAVTRVGGGCFPAGTPVLTSDGPAAIETVEPGTQVYSCELPSAEWTLAKVIERQVVQYKGAMITIQTVSQTFQATGNHPFYVLSGNRLESRRIPQDISVTDLLIEGPGRWVEASDLKIGDVLMTASGEPIQINNLSSLDAETDVYNLEIEGYHNYAISQKGILVHNKGAAESSEVEPLVTVHGTIVLEHYKVAVLGAADVSALLEWLQMNDYQANSDSKEIFDDYIERNWAFVAVKLNPSERRHYENEFLPPLTIKYRYNELIFPLLISSISTTEQVKITLYVIAESTVISTNFRTATLEYNDHHEFSEEHIETCIQNTLRGGRSVAVKPLVNWWRNSFNPDSHSVQVRRDEGKALAILWRGAFCPSLYHQRFKNSPYADHPGIGLEFVDRLCISPLPKCDMYLTRLEARIDPGDMTEDVSFMVTPHQADFEVRFGRIPYTTGKQFLAVLIIALILFSPPVALVVGLAFLVRSLVRKYRQRQDRRVQEEALIQDSSSESEADSHGQ